MTHIYRAKRDSIAVAGRWVLAASAIVAMTAGCSDAPSSIDVAVTDSVRVARALSVSEPLTAMAGLPAPSGAVSSSSTGAAGVAYVSLPPGTAHAVTSIVIANAMARWRGTLRVEVVDGGFDPVAVEAEPDDELELTLLNGETVVALSTTRVPRRRPPQVTRTNPPKQRTDVPLNLRVIVVFNEPIDPASLTTSSFQLRRGTTSVAGVVQLTGGSGVTAEFVPAAALDPRTAYSIVVAGVLDLSGDELEAEVSIGFTTSETASLPATVSVRPGDVELNPGRQVQLSATAMDAAGYVVDGGTSTWTSGQPQVATVSPVGLVTAVAIGNATITGCRNSVCGSVSVTVIAAPLGVSISVISLPELQLGMLVPISFSANGEILGYGMRTDTGDHEWHAFAWTPPDGLVDLGPMGCVYSTTGIRDDGAVVGVHRIAPGQEHACVWTPAGGRQFLGFPGNTISIAYDINNASQVVGYSDRAGDTHFRAFLWTSDGGMRDLGALAGHLSSEAVALNDLGQAVGSSAPQVIYSRPVMWTASGEIVSLGSLTGASDADDEKKSVGWGRAVDINNAGQVVGWSVTPNDGFHAFLWTAETGMRDIGAFMPRAISEEGRVVGYRKVPSTGPARAVVWTAENGIQDLGALSGGESYALRVSDKGHVFGHGVDANGRFVLLLWTLSESATSKQRRPR